MSHDEMEHYTQASADKPILALYCNWTPSPTPEKAGFLIQVENVQHSPVSAKNVRVALTLRPLLPILGLARPSVGSGWFEDLHHLVEPLDPHDLNPGESRYVARVLQLPGPPDNDLSYMTLDITISAKDCIPIKGTLSIPVWSYARSIPDDFAERTLILTNAIVRTDELPVEGTPTAIAIPINPVTPSTQIKIVCQNFHSLLAGNPP